MIRTPNCEIAVGGFCISAVLPAFFGTTLTYIGKLLCTFISARSVEILLSIVTKQSIESLSCEMWKVLLVL